MADGSGLSEFAQMICVLALTVSLMVNLLLGLVLVRYRRERSGRRPSGNLPEFDLEQYRLVGRRRVVDVRGGWQQAPAGPEVPPRPWSATDREVERLRLLARERDRGGPHRLPD